jgi:hypothetical protein
MKIVIYSELNHFFIYNDAPADMYCNCAWTAKRFMSIEEAKHFKEQFLSDDEVSYLKFLE